jgi:glutaminyl-tRNA synthetase
MPADGRKIKGTIHWLSAKYAQPTSLMLYDRLFNIENTADVPEGQSYLDFLNEQSLTRIDGAMIEPCLATAEPGERFQFVRVGYFCKDTKNDNTFNRVVGLKDSFPAKKN